MKLMFIAPLAAALSFGGAAAAGGSDGALTILQRLAAGDALTAADSRTLEESYAVSRLSRREKIALRDRIYLDNLKLPPGVETALISQNPRQINNP